jgi:iron(III) transport system substrate-binding protein
MKQWILILAALMAFLILEAIVPGAPQAQSLTIYSGRSEELVGPIIERFSEATGVRVRVRYGGTSELAATILEEGTCLDEFQMRY